jgi:hypothetical protein
MYPIVLRFACNVLAMMHESVTFPIGARSWHTGTVGGEVAHAVKGMRRIFWGIRTYNLCRMREPKYALRDPSLRPHPTSLVTVAFFTGICFPHIE